MSKVQLYQGIIDATKTIVAKFGKDVVKEERFVYILADMYPDRDNPAVFKIIKSVITDGCMQELVVSPSNNIQNCINRLACALNQKNGYDEKMVEDMLYSIAIGYGVISLSDFNAIVTYNSTPNNNNLQNCPKPIPKPKQYPQQPSKQGPSHSNHNKNPFPNQDNNWNTIKLSLILIWGVLGLLVSPYVYLALVRTGGWWPLPAIIVLALIQFLTIGMTFVSFGEECVKTNHVAHPIIGGMYSAMICCSVLFWISSPIVMYTDLFSLQTEYYDLWRSTDSPSIVSYLLTLACAFFCCAFLSEVTLFSGIHFSLSAGFWSGIKAFRMGGDNNKLFANGFVVMMMFFLFVGMTVCVIPIINQLLIKNKIELTNDKIDKINQQKVIIKKERENRVYELSFSDFYLGTSLDSCIIKINSSEEYNFLKDIEIPYDEKEKSLHVNEVSYKSVIDSIVYLSMIWDNKNVVVHLYFNSKRLMGLSYSTVNVKDSIVMLYTKKYGEPEYKLKKFDIDSYEILPFTFDEKYHLTPDVYNWTYKNCLIEVRSDRNLFDREVGVEVTYFCRILEKLLSDKEARKKRLQEMAKKRQEESLRQEEIERKRFQEEERLRQSKNHRESINKI